MDAAGFAVGRVEVVLVVFYQRAIILLTKVLLGAIETIYPSMNNYQMVTYIKIVNDVDPDEKEGLKKFIS